MKTIRIWKGATVVALVTVDGNGSSAYSGAAGGASNSTKVDIEIDPWVGDIVDHAAGVGVVCYLEEDGSTSVFSNVADWDGRDE